MKPIRTIVDEVWAEPTEADIPTPFPELNRMLHGGWRYQHITVVAGRTAMGKTALGNYLGLWTARNRGKDVGFFSLEMGAKDQLSRFCKTLSEGDERPEYMKEEIQRLPIWLDDSPRISPLYIRGEVQRTNEKLSDDGRRLHQICIDYVQLMRATGANSGNRNAELDDIMGELLSVAKDFNLHILLLAQINRGPENRQRFGSAEDARPAISDLRDSGTLENTANEILLMYRPDYYEEFQTGDGVTELHVAKNREGRTGTVKVQFIPEEMSFAP